MLTFPLGYLNKLYRKSSFQFCVVSLVCVPHPLYWLMQIDVSLKNRDYQSDGEFAGFCGSRKDHTVIRTHFNSFYLWVVLN